MGIDLRFEVRGLGRELEGGSGAGALREHLLPQAEGQGFESLLPLQQVN